MSDVKSDDSGDITVPGFGKGELYPPAPRKHHVYRDVKSQEEFESLPNGAFFTKPGDDTIFTKTPIKQGIGKVYTPAKHGLEVPGRGEGDKVKIMAEPGEFVVSNAMFEANPGLREELKALHKEALGSSDGYHMREGGPIRRNLRRAGHFLGNTARSLRRQGYRNAQPVEIPDGLRITKYGPGSPGANRADRLERVGHSNNPLQFGDAALPRSVANRYGLRTGDPFTYQGRTYTYSDTPNPKVGNVLDEYYPANWRSDRGGRSAPMDLSVGNNWSPQNWHDIFGGSNMPENLQDPSHSAFDPSFNPSNWREANPPTSEDNPWPSEGPSWQLDNPPPSDEGGYPAPVDWRNPEPGDYTQYSSGADNPAPNEDNPFPSGDQNYFAGDARQGNDNPGNDNAPSEDNPYAGIPTIDPELLNAQRVSGRYGGYNSPQSQAWGGGSWGGRGVMGQGGSFFGSSSPVSESPGTVGADYVGQNPGISTDVPEWQGELNWTKGLSPDKAYAAAYMHSPGAMVDVLTHGYSGPGSYRYRAAQRWAAGGREGPNPNQSSASSSGNATREMMSNLIYQGWDPNKGQFGGFRNYRMGDKKAMARLEKIGGGPWGNKPGYYIGPGSPFYKPSPGAWYTTDNPGYDENYFTKEPGSEPGLASDQSPFVPSAMTHTTTDIQLGMAPDVQRRRRRLSMWKPKMLNSSV